MDYRLQSPYCGGAMKISSQQKGLIMQHLIVRKLTRRELEDKYLRLIDENFDLKRENNLQREKIKVLTTKLLRVSRENNKFKSREFLFMDADDSDLLADSQHQATAVEFMRYRPSSTSVLLHRTFSRGSTRSDLHENLDILGNNNHQTTPTAAKHPTNNKLENGFADSSNTFDTSMKIKELQEEVNRLAAELSKLKEMRDTERTANERLETEVSDLKVQLKSKNDTALQERDKKIKELECQLRTAEEKYAKVQEESRREQEKLNNLLKCEQAKSESQRKSFETSQQALETLTERVASLEKKNSELSVQNDKLSKVTQDSMSFKKSASDLRAELDLKERELETERANRATIEHSQSELLKKIKELQRENDELVVKLEGLQTENDGLITKNKRLEENVRVLESSNKVQLQKVNDTLKVPTSSAVSSPLQKKPPTAATPTPSSMLKSPEIPTTSVSDAGSYDRTLAHKVALTPEKTSPAIPASPMSVVSSAKSPTTTMRTDATAFADLFSRSISKDDDDDQFDTKTYSIDQKKQQPLIVESTETVYFDAVSNLQDEAIDKAAKLLVDEMMMKQQRPNKIDLPNVVFKPSEPSQKTRAAKQKKEEAKSFVKNQQSSEHDNKTTSRVGNDESEPTTTAKTAFARTVEELLRRKANSQTFSNANSSPPLQLLLDNTRDERLLMRFGSNIIEIEVISLEATQDLPKICSLNSDELLYVEYSFLGWHGHLLETQALPAPKKPNETIFYRQVQKFVLDSSKHAEQIKILSSMLATDTHADPMKFYVVSEALEDDKTDSVQWQRGSECREVGFAHVKINAIVKEATENSEIVKAEVFSTIYPHNLIAYLLIRLTGIDFMKQLAGKSTHSP